MRTTVTIRDDLREIIRRRAFEERRTFTAVLNDLLERGIAAEAGPARRILGAYADQIRIADDFDEELDDFTEALAEPIEP